ncbi:small subunit ribosomal protein S15 [Mycoplasmoides fastidiosum]|uniref:Small ribosomal subunit protein uS15 n=1 Tax=Mycoplasmoides fastidiosum TaxID=92758 RepID=A0ABU0LYQ9_9BACT|nr:30S ribosomal protein S15 [Mycoplasmoides fastidiosum]MDQ0513733.1 small subunit ribosomal protein S15 [Mycoplasmoides fastidiosum]UUD38126.1 30S ribosomal protein S15 [Mycoplasmoides fastidiosum]
MAITKERKSELITTFGGSATNTGSTQAQVALLTERIKSLTEHLKVNKKDFSSKRGLFKLVSQRRRLLNYLKKRNIDAYRDLIKVLGLRS